MTTPRYGTLYGVSLGPGDPDWITRGAWQVLTGPARWAYPVRTIGGDSVALAIAERAGLACPQDALPVHFPMSHDPLVLTRAWQRAAEALLPTLTSGRDVALLVEGDASTYATFQYLAAALRNLAPEVPVVALPGVNAFAAAAAKGALALAAQEERIAVIPANYGVAFLNQLLPHFETLVLMKIKPLWRQLLDWLNSEGLLAHALYAERVGMPEERLVAGPAIAALAEEPPSYLALLIVRNPTARPVAERVRGCRAKRSTASAKEPPALSGADQ